MSPEDRAECISLIGEAVLAGARKFMACETLDLEIRTVERWELNLEDGRRGPHNSPSNALSEEERARVLTIANSAAYASLAPCQIVPLLADKGEYVCSESSFYRILNAEKLLAHRSKAAPRKHKKPQELVATKPNQIWSWDITYLRAAIKGTYFYLYLPLDIFSRKIVHWEVHANENAQLASGMIEKACFANEIVKDQIVLHSDNGGPMKGATMLATLERLGVAPSFSRPRVSDDNAFSEAIFKTLKYCPSFPERGFGSLEDARAWVEKFVHWYNCVHLHSGISFVTPASRHSGEDIKILMNRHLVYEAARAARPNRWSRRTRNWKRIGEVELNPRKKDEKLVA